MNQKAINITKLAPVMLIYIVMGFADIIGVATAYIKSDFNLADKWVQLLPFLALIWFFFLSVPTGILQDRFGKKTLVSIGVAFIAVGMLIPFVYYSFVSMMFSIVFMGVGNTIIQVSANPLLYDVIPQGKFSSFMSFGQFIKAISSLLGPILAAMAATSFGNWKLVFLVYGITSILAVLWVNATVIKETKNEEKAATFKSCFSLLNNKFVLIMVLGIFFVVGADVGMNTNITLFLQGEFGLEIEKASLGISLYFTALMIGRFLGSILLNWISSYKFLLATTLLALLGAVLMFMTSNLFMARVTIFIVGLASANLFPLIFSIAIEKYPKRANEISGLMVMAISGGAFIPPVMGFVSSSFGIRLALVVIIITMLILLGISLFVFKSEKNAKKLEENRAVA
ncbi:MAG: MFS transporter [Bacteroidota bacterium]